jgi:hypothetical protein
MDKIKIRVNSDLRAEEIVVVRRKKRVTIYAESKAVARRLTQMVSEMFEDEPRAIGFKDE